MQRLAFAEQDSLWRFKLPRLPMEFEGQAGFWPPILTNQDDCGALVETLLQWMSTNPAAGSIDRELGTLEQDLIGQTPLLSYLRYNIELDRDTLRTELQMDLSPEQVTPLSEMDDPGNMPMLKMIGELVGEKKVDGKHFPVNFELTT